MKIQPKKTKLPLLATAVVLLLTTIGYGVYAYYNDSWPFATTPSTAPIDNKKSQADKPPMSKNSDNPADKTPVKYSTPRDTHVPENKLTGVINYKNTSNGTLTLRNTIDQLVSSGTCTLTLMQTGTNKTISRTAEIISNPSSSTCKGFSLPLSELSAGKWDIKIIIKSGDKHGTLKSTVTI